MLPQHLFVTVVNRGQSEAVLQHLQVFGVGGGVVMPGEGTVFNKGLEFFGLNESLKDIIFLPVPLGFEEALHEHMLKKFKLHRRHRGIAFSLPLSRFQRLSFQEDRLRRDPYSYEYHCLITILERTKAKECVHHAQEAGASGGTILHGRGAGIPRDSLFELLIEPQKDVVFFILPTAILENVQKAITTHMHLEEEGRGILFALPVHRVTGLFSRDEEKKR